VTERSVGMFAEVDEARLSEGMGAAIRLQHSSISSSGGVLDFVAMNEIDARDEDLDLANGNGARQRVPGRPPLYQGHWDPSIHPLPPPTTDRARIEGVLFQHSVPR